VPGFERRRGFLELVAALQMAAVPVFERRRGVLERGAAVQMAAMPQDHAPWSRMIMRDGVHAVRGEA
jgi:hypothetical protein